jgi:hypothetical protein
LLYSSDTRSEIARQLTLYEFDLFRRVLPREFLGLAWTNPNMKELLAPNLTAMIQHSNFIGDVHFNFLSIFRAHPFCGWIDQYSGSARGFWSSRT